MEATCRTCTATYNGRMEHCPACHETMPYYSDDALAKQAALAALPDGTVAPWSMLLGICEPRVKPADAERCNCCGLDARDSEGGEAIDGKRWCFICIGRGHHEDDE